MSEYKKRMKELNRFRFCPEVSKDEAWVTARSHESYAKNYSIIFPHDEPLAGRNMKKASDRK